ncbi:MAG: DMT family transporter [Clostridiales bacterium]|nr:DMT family transporter [Clostridiales bacterium]
MTGKMIAAALLASGAWGFSFIATDILLETYSPVQVQALRWPVAALVFAVLGLTGVVKMDFRGKPKKWILLTAAVQPCLYAIFETYGLAYTSSSMSSIFIATIPCMTLILGMLFFHRHTARIGTIGILLAFTGVVICTLGGGGFAAGGKLFGYLLLIGAVFIGALYSQFSAQASAHYTAIEITAMMAFAGAVWFVPLNFLMGYGVETYTLLATDWRLVLGALFLGVACSSGGYFGYNYVLGKAKDPAIAGNVVQSLITVIGVTAGVMLRGDAAGLNTVIGVAVTLTGVIISSRAE